MADTCTFCGAMCGPDGDDLFSVSFTVGAALVALGVACSAPCQRALIERAERWPGVYAGQPRPTLRGRAAQRAMNQDVRRRADGAVALAPVPPPRGGAVPPARRHTPDVEVRGPKHEVLVLAPNGLLLDRAHTGLTGRALAQHVNDAGLSEVVLVVVDGKQVRQMVAVELARWSAAKSRAVVARFARLYRRSLVYRPLVRIGAGAVYYGARGPQVQRKRVDTNISRDDKARVGGNIYRATVGGAVLAYIVAKSMRLARRAVPSDARATAHLVRVAPDKVRGPLLYAHTVQAAPDTDTRDYSLVNAAFDAATANNPFAPSDEDAWLRHYWGKERGIRVGTWGAGR